MRLSAARIDEANFQRLQRVKRQPAHFADALGPELVGFFKESVDKRCQKLGKLAACWEKLVPELLAEHCALESFSRGILTVVVDSASHLYDLKHLLLAGLDDQLLLAGKSSGLKKIKLKPGRWYEGSNRVGAKPTFR